MTEVVSVHFKSKGKVYFFLPNGFELKKGDNVIVETSKGLEYAECVRGNHEVEDSTLVPPLRPVVRVATEEDTRRAEENKQKEAEAFEICRGKIEEHELDMKLVDVEYNFEGNKILFFFTSDGRVDFRELVKDLAAIFKMRIELRQIGVRDEARMLGGLGICGRPFCCAQFLDDFQPVSIKMAKTQGLSLNPTKISGTCGRLMCCLKYEQDAYEDLVKRVPKVDAFVETPLGKGSVTDVNLLRGTMRVRLEDQTDTSLKTFEADEVEVLGGKAKRAEYLALKAEGKIPEEPPHPIQQERANPEIKHEPEPVKEETAEKPEKVEKAESRHYNKPRHRREAHSHNKEQHAEKEPRAAEHAQEHTAEKEEGKLSGKKPGGYRRRRKNRRPLGGKKPQTKDGE